MKMSYSDYRVFRSNEDGSISVVSDILTMGQEWPSVITYQGRSYRFQTNELMEDWMVGNYGGHARFVEISRQQTCSGY